MITPPATQQTSRSSTGARSQQSTLVPARPPSEALQKALRSFRNRLTPDQLQDFKITTYEQLCNDLDHLQQEMGKRKLLMNLARIKPFLQGMQRLGQVVGVFLNVHEIVCFVWGPIKFLLMTASAVSEAFETLLDAFKQIGEQLPLLADYEMLHGDNPKMVDALEMIYIDIFAFYDRATKFVRGSRIRTLFRASWRGFETEFNGILQTLQRHNALVENRFTVSQYQKYHEDMMGLKDRLNQQVEEERMKKLIRVSEWLAVGTALDDEHRSFQKIRHKYSSTARWIIDRPIIKDWIELSDPAMPLLWMHGIPGAGKTILASAIIDECKKTRDSLTGFFYCHDGISGSNTAMDILKGLANQLLNQARDDLLPTFYNRRTLSGDATLRSISVAKKLLDDCCDIIPRLFLVVDGLDECGAGERKEVLETLTQLVGEYNTNEPGKLRVLIVSQHYADISKTLHGAGKTKLAPRIFPISEADVEGDIKAYVRVWVDRIAAKYIHDEKPFSEDIREYLRNLTFVNARGMFLYAKLVLENLEALNTREKIINAIKEENFPKELKDAYARIVNRIKDMSQEDCSQDWEDAKKLLGWMVCAKRELTWKEIQVALSVDVTNQSIEYDDRRMRKHIHEICGSLVIATEGRVTLVHSTAKTYITRITEDIHEPSIECELATLCLQYLTFECFETEGHDEQELCRYMLEGHFAFQDYAVAKWFHHVNAFVSSGKDFFRKATLHNSLLDDLAEALDEFMARYMEPDWEAGLVQSCKNTCEEFQPYALYENLLLLTSHIYTFQQKGFDARHEISIKSLATALERNRKLLEEDPANLAKPQLDKYNKFYDTKKRFKCTKITCRYFSQGFTDKKAKKRHVDIHNRPYYCEVTNCIGEEGFANEKDLKNHKRAFHPESCDLSVAFNSATAKRSKADHACTFCGKTFSQCPCTKSM
ncbi:C2H2 domain-containing protein [Setomelanomma holmii]|uniref:C2H2 domain-containing protein n=1 Tax=Setomelanomma holmii TaxID=210430 RepID=A0A9P4LH03_9PLEO|nr:C2H2 domain-containing protein [Setomelanomma holmii]